MRVLSDAEKGVLALRYDYKNLKRFLSLTDWQALKFHNPVKPDEVLSRHLIAIFVLLGFVLIFKPIVVALLILAILNFLALKLNLTTRTDSALQLINVMSGLFFNLLMYFDIQAVNLMKMRITISPFQFGIILPLLHLFVMYIGRVCGVFYSSIGKFVFYLIFDAVIYTLVFYTLDLEALKTYIHVFNMKLPLFLLIMSLSGAIFAIIGHILKEYASSEMLAELDKLTLAIDISIAKLI